MKRKRADFSLSPVTGFETYSCIPCERRELRKHDRRTGKGNQTIRVQDSANEVLSESVSPDVELIIFTTRMEELASHNILNYSYPRAGVISL